ncbi:sulfatase-like hydrolase/transferase [Paraflavitalea sp. CAU 1676]|uniref:sulfatase-like hydrolase/transferase n=1 Tax=Paraflavitalea sp. CAU 1676 TaxID=3032598 RepID=UPI0023DC510D|nr:sulfatase-like hydrolase/transferase [Paraflavitalea sp. CAU 1676]MDF2192146.1 sulfatase-like hydrolase/transferase [Paraflavitalea sp. CAU 1676]
MKTKSVLFLLLLLCVVKGFAQPRKTKNVILISLDGYRWREIFLGADSALLYNKRYTKDSAWTFQKYWAATVQERREKLMPFTWSQIAKNGQLYGNRTLGNKVDLKNTFWFSYPGRSETWTGHFDPAINSNDKIDNPNENVMEFINKQKGFAGKTAAFASWDVVAWILNRNRNGITVNIWGEDVKGPKLTPQQKEANAYQHMMPDPWGQGERLDVSTYRLSKAYLEAQHPRLFYIDFGDLDCYAHDGAYNKYLDAANKTDLMIKDLWEYLQKDPFYKDQTTLIICADHGRGEDSKWTGHGTSAPHSNETYLLVMGPDTKPLGEVKTAGQIYQDQFAQTIANLLGFQFTPKHPVGEAVKTVLNGH